MSSATIMHRLMLNGPLPQPPLHSLVATATELPDSDRWEAGAAIYTYPCDLPSGHDPCSLGSDRVKADPDEITHPDAFPAFTAYLGEICSSVGIGSWEEWKARANVALLASESWALERQLVSAEYMSGPSLNDDNIELILNGGGQDARTMVGLLEEAIAKTGRQGVLHLTPGVVTYLGMEFFRYDNGILRTASGTPVIVGQGYVGAPGPPEQPDAQNGEDWIYASGPVVYRRSSEITALPESLGEALDRSDNTVIYRAERDLWVAFDGCVQAAARASWANIIG